tara:strand:- start:328 stop:594 length:267 start_codon:yes stop_codon:yes gene_type:complete
MNFIRNNYIYFLIYKIKNNEKMWIVKIIEDRETLNRTIESFHKFNSKKEDYYIFERKIINKLDTNINRKNFQIFEKKLHDRLILNTNC